MSEKKSELAAQRANAIRKAWVDRNKIVGDARTILGELELWLLQHQKAAIAKAARCSRLSSDVRRVIENGGGRCVASSPSELGAKLLAGKSLQVIVSEEQSSPAMDQQYKRINFSSGSGNIAIDPNDPVIFKEWDAERASVLILREAIAQQKKIVAAATKSSMEKFSRTVAASRVETAHELLGLIAQMRRIVEPDQSLATGLELDECAELRPQPFPQHHLLSSAAVQWLLDCVSEKIISREELSGLDLETVSTEEPQQDVKKEPWLDCAV